LAQHKGDLHLGLRSVSPEIAKILVHHKGKLWLLWLKTLSAEAAETLKANPDIRLPEKFR